MKSFLFLTLILSGTLAMADVKPDGTFIADECSNKAAVSEKDADSITVKSICFGRIQGKSASYIHISSTITIMGQTEQSEDVWEIRNDNQIVLDGSLDASGVFEQKLSLDFVSGKIEKLERDSTQLQNISLLKLNIDNVTVESTNFGYVINTASL